jgi:hypothetical protein
MIDNMINWPEIIDFIRRFYGTPWSKVIITAKPAPGSGGKKSQPS